MKFTCGLCDQEFEGAETEEELEAQLEKEFPGYKPEDCVRVCDPCFRLGQARGLIP